MSFSDKAVPVAMTVVGTFFFSLNGFLNVALFAVTRPGVFPGHRMEIAPVTEPRASNQNPPSEAHRNNVPDEEAPAPAHAWEGLRWQE